MGERQSDGGPAGRRRAHPEGMSSAAHPEGMPSARSGTGTVPVGLEELLAAALVRDVLDAGAEQRAVAAFLTARESRAHGARTRRRDDWRARRRRLGGDSLKATLTALVAGLTLSGVAVAGIGAAGLSTDGPARDTGPAHTPPRTTAPAAPGSTAPDAGSGLPDRTRSGTAPDAEASCATPAPSARERPTEAAGGAAHVGADCAEERSGGTVRPGSTGTPGEENTGRADGAGNGSSGGAGQGPDGNRGKDPDTAPDEAPGGDGRGGSAGRPAEPGAGKP